MIKAYSRELLIILLIISIIYLFLSNRNLSNQSKDNLKVIQNKDQKIDSLITDRIIFNQNIKLFKESLNEISPYNYAISDSNLLEWWESLQPGLDTNRPD